MTQHLIFLAGLCSIVFALLPIADRIRRRWGAGPSGSRVSHLVAFSLMAILGSLLGHPIAPGVTLTAHVPIVSAATIGFGPWVGGGTALVAILARLLSHEIGPRVAEVVVHFAFAACLAHAWRHRMKQWGHHLLLLAVAGLGNGTIGAVALLASGRPLASDRLAEQLPTEVFLSYCLGTLLLGGFVLLQRSWQHTQALVEGALETTADAFNLVDDFGRILEVNPGMEAMTGYSRAELVGKYLYELRPRETPEEMAASLASIRAKGRQRYETRWRRKDGTEFELEVSAAVAPWEVGGYYAFLRDITERKATEHRLRLQDARLRLGLEAAGMFTWELDPVSGRFHYSDNLPAVTGNPHSPSSETLHQVLDRIHPEDRARAREAVERALSDGTPFECDYRIHLSDGSWRWFLSQGRRLAAEPGRPEPVLGVSIDITRRQEDATRLKLQETRLRLALEAASMVTWELDLATASIRYSDNLAAVSGSPDTSPYQSLDTFLQQLHPDDRDRTLAAFDATITSGGSFECDYRVRVADGTWHWLLGKGRCLPGEEGRPRQVLGVALDITERRHAEDAAHRWRQLFENAEFGLAAVDVATNTFIEVNAAFARQRGYTPAELAGQPALSIIAPESRADSAHRRRLVDEAGHQVFESVHLRKDGSRFPVLMEVTTIRDADGRSVSRVACALDITERKRIEAEALAGRAKLEAALESMADAVFISDTQGRFIDFNQAFTSFHRFESKDQCARTLAEYPGFLDIFLPDGKVAPFEQWPVPRALRGESGTNVELRLHRRDTGESWTGSYSFSPIRNAAGHIVGSVVAARDITERLRQEQALRDSELRLSLATDAAQLGVWDHDLRTHQLVWSPRHAQMWGYGPGEFPGTQEGFTSRIHPDDLAGMQAIGQRALQDRTPFEYEYRVRWPDGTQRWIASHGRYLFDPEGRPTRLTGVVFDITERKEAGDALRRSEERFRGTLETMIEGCQIIDFDWRYRFVNAAAAAAGRTTVDALLGRTIMEAYPGIDRAPFFAQLRRCLEERVASQFENEFTYPDGSNGWFELVVQPVPEGLFILSLDITERKRAEAALRESEARYRLVAESTTDVIWLYDFGAGHFTYASPAVEPLRGYTPAELRQQSLADVLTPDSYRAASARLARRIAQFEAGDDSVRTQTHQVDQTRRDGTSVATEVVSTLIADAHRHVTHLQGVSRDITERRRAEAALRESLLLRREAEKIGRIGAWKVNPRKDFLYWTEGVYELLEVPLDYRPGLEEGMSFYDPDGLPTLREALNNALEHGTTFAVEIGLTTRTGRKLWTEVRGLRRLEEDGQAFIIGTFHDITERRNAEQALREKEERLRLALDASGQGLYDLNIQTGVAVVNEEYVRMLGHDPADFQETNAAWVDRLHPDDRDPAATAYLDYIAGRSPEYRIEFRQRSASGDWVWIQSIGRIASRDATGNPLRMLGTHLNITERKRAEDRSRRLRDLGLAVAGITDRDRALRLCLDAGLDIAGVDAGGIYLVDPITGNLELTCHSGLSDAFVAAVEHFGADAPNARWARQGRFFHGSVDLLHLPATASERVEGLKAISLLSILDDERLVAVLNIASHRIEEVPAPARTALESVANTIGSLLQRLGAEEALRRANLDLEHRVADRTRELASSEARFRHLLEMAPLPMGISNQRGELTFLNARHARTFGYRRDEIPTLDQWWLRAYPEESYRKWVRERWESATVQAAREGTDIEAQECRITCRDGSVRDVLISSIRLGEETLATFLDITQLRKTDAMLRTLRRAMEQSPIVVAITNATGAIEYANPQFEIQTGYPLDEVIGQNPRILKSGVHPPEFYRQLWKTIQGGEVWRGEFCNRRKDGSLFWESTAIAPIHDVEGNLTHYVAIKEDITERRRIAEELRQARDAAETANRAKSRFLANMSHEIRTPMNAILGFAQLMQRDGNLLDTHRKHLATINRSGEYLLRLINDILDMSKIEAGRMHIAPADFDFRALLEDLAALFRLRAEGKGLRFEVERAPGVPARIHADAGRIRQVLINLLGNAIKFTDHGTVGLLVSVGPPPTIAADAAADRTDCLLHLDVQDTGPGIPADDLNRLFEPFEQSGSGQHHGGTGLGLAICRQLARLMGGEVSATSQPGAGSTFRFTFVASALEEPVLLPNPSPSLSRHLRRLPADLPAPAVLVVDDVASNRDLLRALLEDVGFAVHEAENGAEAVAFCQTFRPDVVLMDRRMPVLDGLAATRAIRALPHGAAPRILMVTASVLGNTDEEWRKAGADGFIGKPVRHDELLDEIGRLLQLEYSEDEPATPSCLPVNLGEAVGTLPAPLRAELLDATESGDISRLRELVTRQVLPLNRPLADSLRESIAAYDYTTILGLLRPPTP